LIPTGVDARTGAYLRPPLAVRGIARAVRGSGLSRKRRLRVRGLPRGVDARDLRQTGWGVVFADGAEEERLALGELLHHRRRQAGPRYRELVYHPEESSLAFTGRHRKGPGPVDPDRLPYYLLLVGDPEAIPYPFQHQLDVAYAVGRLAFEDPDGYTRYARSVVEAESGRAPARTSERGPAPRLPRVSFFAPRHPDDEATRLTADHMVSPLVSKLRRSEVGWRVEKWLGARATKERLSALLGDGERPDLLFTAGHGLGFLPDDPRQLRRQGALLCQGWPGPVAGRGQRVAGEHLFAGEDLASETSLHGLVSFHFACFSAGTPRLDSFAHLGGGAARALAPRPFVAHLPQRLLSAGALAVIGHVDTAWQCSFRWDSAGEQLQGFESTLLDLMRGYPVGAAMECFGERHGELAAEVLRRVESGRLEGSTASPGEETEDAEVSAEELDLAFLWLANNDARSYVVLGDPAVRLRP
jgi:hypothetical protein